MGGNDWVACSAAGWTAHYDEVAEVPWMQNEAQGLFLTLDSPRSIAAKGAWVQLEGLGGLMFWELGGDTDDLQMLTTLCHAMAPDGSTLCQ